MARHRGKTQMSRSSSNEFGNMGSVMPRKPKYRFFLVLFGIFLCIALVLYFSLSQGEMESQSTDDVLWHKAKNTWNAKAFSQKKTKSIINLINMDRLTNNILPNFMIVRQPGSENITKVKNYISRTMTDLGWTVEEHSFEDMPPPSYSKNPITFTNVIATKNPLARRRLVMACHYDSKVTPNGFLGATDSAVPCAMLVEIASSLNQILSSSLSDLTLQLIFFDGEEALVDWTTKDSLYGARNLAKKWESEPWPRGMNSDKSTLHSIDLFVLLDLLGEKDPSFILKSGTDVPRHYREISRIENTLSDNKHYFKESPMRGNIQDDHIPFLERNVPILHMIAYPFPKNWHLITDNGDNIDHHTVHRLMKIFTVFTAGYLHLS